MSRVTWQEALVVAQTDGTALGTSTTETSIIPAGAKISLPGGYFNATGQKLRITAKGRVSNIVTTPGTLTFRFKLGPTANIAVAASQALALNIVAKTNVSWWLDMALTLRAIGSGTSANFMFMGSWTSESVIGSPLPSAGGAGTLMIPASAPAVGTGFDSTVANVTDLTAQWSISNAGNTIQVHEYALEAIN